MFHAYSSPGRGRGPCLEHWRVGSGVTRYRAEAGSDAAGRRGRRVGIAYQLDGGEIIYVPEGP